MFDAPYLLTMGAGNGGWVRYQLLPASMSEHRVNFVYNFIEVDPDEPPQEIWEGLFHCVHCKLMGIETTMETYTCFGLNKIDWMKECGCSQCKRRVPCTWAEVSRISHGESIHYKEPTPKANLMQYRRDYYIPTEEDLDKYSAIRTEVGWWSRKTLQDKLGIYYLERKWLKPR